MPTTYRLQNTNSDLTGGADFNKAVTASVATGSANVSLSATETRTSYGYTASGDPGASGVTGSYTIEFDCDTNTFVQLSVQIHRVNSSGTVQTSSSVSSEQGCGQVSFSFPSQSLGTWASGNRLRVDYIFRNTDSGGQIATINYGRTTGEVVVPWGGVTIPVFMHHLMQQGIS